MRNFSRLCRSGGINIVMSVGIFFSNTADCGTQSVTELRSIVEASNNVDNKVENSY